MSFSRIRSHIRSIEPVLWLVLILSLTAAWAFILRPSLPRETDTELHVFRAAEVGYNIRAGAIYSRWAPDFYYGYGYPIFNYYAPLTYYLANLMTLFIPGGAVLGVKFVFILGFIIAGYSVYFLGRRHSTSFGGLIASASYLFAPYVYLIDPHLRGDLAEFFALAVGPLAFWQMSRHFDAPRSKTIIAATLSITALILTHNLLALVYFAMLLAYTLWSIIFKDQRPTSNKALLVRAAPLILGLLVSSFFWLPVILEQSAVQLSNLIGPGHFDFRNHFLSLGELFGPSVPLDLGSVNPEFRLNLGLVQWLFAIAGLGTVIQQHIKKPNQSTVFHHLFWIISGCFLIVLMLPVSGGLWDAIPQMAFLQFPWRLLGPANLCLAILAAPIAHVPILDLELRWKRGAGMLVFVLPLVSSLPIFVPPAWDGFGAADRSAILDFELAGIALGTTATGDFVPSDVQLVPGPNPDLIASYESGGPVDKVNRRTLSEGTTVDIVSHGPTSDRFNIHSDEPFTLRLYTFMFAGWKATVDGHPVPIEVAQPEGFITVPIPEGSHQVRVWIGSTPARTLSLILALIGLGAMAVVALFVRDPEQLSQKTPTLSRIQLISLSGALGGTLVMAAAGSVIGLFQPTSTDLSVRGAEYSEHNYVEGGADLLAYDISSTEVVPGDTIMVTLYWKAREPIVGNYQSFIHLTTDPPLAWAQSDNLNPGDYPTSRWPLDRYIRDEHTIEIPHGTPPGLYTLRVGLWNQLSGVRQLILEPDGTVLGDSIALDVDVRVNNVKDVREAESPTIEHHLDEEPLPDLRLLGFDLRPGSQLDFQSGYMVITLYWEAVNDMSADVALALRLLGEGDNEELSLYQSQVGGRFPTSQWGKGSYLRDMHALWIGPNVTPGSYQLQLAVQFPDTNASIQWMTLTIIERGNSAIRK